MATGKIGAHRKTEAEKVAELRREVAQRKAASDKVNPGNWVCGWEGAICMHGGEKQTCLVPSNTDPPQYGATCPHAHSLKGTVLAKLRGKRS